MTSTSWPRIVLEFESKWANPDLNRAGLNHPPRANMWTLQVMRKTTTPRSSIWIFLITMWTCHRWFYPKQLLQWSKFVAKELGQHAHWCPKVHCGNWSFEPTTYCSVTKDFKEKISANGLRCLLAQLLSDRQNRSVLYYFVYTCTCKLTWHINGFTSVPKNLLEFNILFQLGGTEIYSVTKLAFFLKVQIPSVESLWIYKNTLGSPIDVQPCISCFRLHDFVLHLYRHWHINSF